MSRVSLVQAPESQAPVQRVIDPRVDDILVQARHAFVEKGFDGASMQDLARAAGMSAGNFYRYFPSKAAIVEALVNRDLEKVEQEFSEVLGSPSPLLALREVIRLRLSEDCDKDLPLWAEIMAAAARKPEIAMSCARIEADIIHKIISVLTVGCGLAFEEAAGRFEAHARFMFLLVRSASMESAGRAVIDPTLNSLILRTIDRLIDEITSESSEVDP